MEKLGDILKRQNNQGEISTHDIEVFQEDDRELDTEIECPICHGARFVYPVSDSGKADYRKIVSCKCSSEQEKKDRVKRIQRFSNLGSLSKITFDQLNMDGTLSNGLNIAGFQKAYEAAVKYAEAPSGWFILIGPGGCGKTHLASAIANYQLDTGKSVFYIETASLLDHLRSTFNPASEFAYDEMFEQIKNISLLVLDDLINSATAWSREKLQQLLNFRYNEKLPTVITSNISVEELDHILDSHLVDTDTCHVFILDLNRKFKNEIDLFNALDFELLREMTFKNFDYKRLNIPDEARQSLKFAFEAAYNFAQSPYGWIIFWGLNGCGKTHLAAAIANHLRSSHKDVMFIIVPDFLDYLRSALNPASTVSYDEIFEKVRKAPVLILDDYGSQTDTSWTEDKLYQLINYRYNAKLPTVITTCLSIEEDKDIDSRVCARMLDANVSTPINITAPAYSANKKNNNKKTRLIYKNE